MLQSCGRSSQGQEVGQECQGQEVGQECHEQEVGQELSGAGGGAGGGDKRHWLEEEGSNTLTKVATNLTVPDSLAGGVQLEYRRNENDDYRRQ